MLERCAGVRAPAGLTSGRMKAGPLSRPLCQLADILLAVRKLVAVIGVTTLVAACGGGSRSTPRSSSTTSARSTQTEQANSTAPSASCITTNGYGGLGGNEAAFDADNNNSTGPAEPTPGAAWYQLVGTEEGCVTAYSVRDSATPPLAARDMLVLVSHGYLPGDAEPVVNTGSCAVWRSAALQRAVGVLFAKATAVAQSGSVPGTARIEATSSSTC